MLRIGICHITEFHESSNVGDANFRGVQRVQSFLSVIGQTGSLVHTDHQGKTCFKRAATGMDESARRRNFCSYLANT